MTFDQIAKSAFNAAVAITPGRSVNKGRWWQVAYYTCGQVLTNMINPGRPVENHTYAVARELL